jgi:hypothetical protein
MAFDEDPFINEAGGTMAVLDKEGNWRKLEYELHQAGWSLVKGGLGWQVLDERGKVVLPYVAVTDGGTKIAPTSAYKIQQMLEVRLGL